MKHLILLNLKTFRNKFRRLTLFDEVKIAIFLLVGLLFLAGIYLGIWRLFSYISVVPLIGNLLINKLLALIFLTSFSMVIISSLITSFNTIFFGKDVAWLMSTPLSAKKVFTYKSLNTSLYSSWMVLIALIPVIIALGQIKHLPFSFYLWAGLMLVPFLLLASFAGILLSLLLMRYFPSHRTREMLLFLGVLFTTGLYMLFRFIQPERLVRPDGLEIVTQYLRYLDAPTAAYLPSWWITAGIYSLFSGSNSGLTFYLSLLVGSTAIALIVIINLAERLFFRGWTEAQIHKRGSVSSRFFSNTRSPFGALLRKDISGFFRDANQWSQLLLLGALVVVYLFSIFKLPLDTMYLQNLVSFFNVGLIGFILAAVALRFAFPSISLEGDSIWLLKSSPISAEQIIKEKFVFGSLPVVLMGLALVIASSWLLHADKFIFILSVTAIAIMAIGLVSLAIGFGAVFPVLDSSSVAQIESSSGGLFFMVTAFFYLGVNISFWAWPVYNFYQKKFGGSYLPLGDFWWAGLGLFAINALAVGLPLWFGVKSLERLER